MEFIRRNVNGQNNSSSGSSSGGINNLAGLSATLATHTIFSQPYDGTNDVRGDLADVQNIDANGDVALDGDIIIRGKDAEGAYNNKDLHISKDDTTCFNGGSEYTFDGPVNAPIFNGDINATDGLITNLTSDVINTKTLSAGEIEAALATITKILSGEIVVDNLTVTKAAHFFSLIIDEIKSVGGQIIISPGNATIDIVKKTAGGNYKCYFRAAVNDHQISNNFAANDQVVCQTFNATTGQSYDVSNTFYWRLVMSRGRETIDGVDYHYIQLSGTDCAENSGEPKAGDMIAQLGNRNTKDRQNAIVLSAYNSDFLDKGLKAPSIVQYKGINDYTLTTHRYNVISNGFNGFRGSFCVESGDSITDLIDALKYDKIVLDVSQAVVDYNDILRLVVSGKVLDVSDEKDKVEIIPSTGAGKSLLLNNVVFTYSEQINNYSTKSNPPTYYKLILKQDEQIVDSITIPVVFEAGAIFEVKEDAITAAVSSVSGDISRIEQKADSVTSTIANMRVGGVNLIDDSEFKTYSKQEDTTWNIKNGTASTSYGYMGQLGVHAISKPSNVNQYGYLDLSEQVLLKKLQPDTLYTFSFYAKGSDGTSTDQGATYKYKGRVMTYVYHNVGAEVSDNAKSFTLNSTWQRYSYTFKTKADLDVNGTYKLLFRLISNESGGTTFYSNAYICMPKLEEGNMATAWDSSTADIRSLITQTADSIEAKIISEDKVNSLISQSKTEIKAEVYNDLNESTGINITDGSIVLNADKTTIKGNLNITDTQNGLTVYETTNYNGVKSLIPRINLQPKQIANIADMAQDTYDFYSKSINQTNNNTWSLDFDGVDYVCNKDDSITFDTFTLNELRRDSNGTLNTPYVSTCKLIVKMSIVKNGVATELDRKECTLSKYDSYGVYKGNEILRFAIPEDATYRFAISSSLAQTAISSYPIMSALASSRVQKASRAITYVGTDGMYCHSGANKYLYVNEKQTIIQHGFNGIKWDNSDVNGNRAMMVVTGVTGSIPNVKPVWFPFYNYTPTFIPTNGVLTKIVNDGNSYSRYAYKIDPLKDNGICYLESGFMDSSGQFVESWILLPPSFWYDESGQGHQLPVGYTVCVINGGFGSYKFNAYVSADVDKSHQAVFIDGHRDKNWKVSLNNEVHWEKFMYVGSYYSSDCGDNQDIWMTLGDAQ